MDARFFSRRMSSSGKILSEEERAAENVYIKGPKPEDKATAGPGESITDAKPSGSSSGSGASTAKVSTDKYMNYVVVAGVVTAFAILAWYMKGSEKKIEVQD
ncbi:PREDICTED: uncharacterized protein At2g27730, mitochondrial-like [Fragaria vesca subsp. vesca]